MRTDEYTLSGDEVDDLRATLDELSAGGLSPTEPDFYEKYRGCHELLSSGLSRFLADFRDDASSAACVVNGFPVDDAVVGPTPRHWERPEGCDATIRPDIYLAMCASMLGEPFAWATLQYGRLVQDIFPIKGDERRESGHGSEAFLTFHTDDAFRPDSPDHLLLFGIRNPDAVPTFVAPMRDIRLSDTDLRVLSEKRFHILPDDEHLRQLELRAPGDPALLRAIEMRDHPQPVSVLFGDPANPHIRLDTPFMRCAGVDPEAQRALTALLTELERVRRPLVAHAGSLLILDNRRVVHGRDSFTARHDGTDRWLRKVIVSRRSAAHGAEPLDRVRL
ncbi:TauD/TfdA family dioxygenase [Streptomyces phaeochromogenes]|uniref:TauD/TfdA family dioxygenase n=1 Tax=Streptomyces phaeochromogenes TaxID=1923 RepID=UPI0038663FC7|nr:TauD/TfdA family dioxygenase [Streptomyces phaeochromogenes]